MYVIEKWQKAIMVLTQSTLFFIENEENEIKFTHSTSGTILCEENPYQI